MGGTLQQPPAAMLEISRRHSVMLHRSCIPSFEIERATMNFHDQRGPSRASLHGLRSQVAFERKPKDGDISGEFNFRDRIFGFRGILKIESHAHYWSNLFPVLRQNRTNTQGRRNSDRKNRRCSGPVSVSVSVRPSVRSPAAGSQKDRCQ